MPAAVWRAGIFYLDKRSQMAVVATAWFML
jgi:hypothetical protein